MIFSSMTLNFSFQMKRKSYDKAEEGLQGKKAQVDSAIKANEQHTVWLLFHGCGVNTYKVFERRNETQSWLLYMVLLEISKSEVIEEATGSRVTPSG